MRLFTVVVLISMAVARDSRCVDQRRKGCYRPCDNIDPERCPRFFFYACPERVGIDCVCRLYRSRDRKPILNPTVDCFVEIERCRDRACPIDYECQESIEYCHEDGWPGCPFDRRIKAKCIRRCYRNNKCLNDKESGRIGRGYDQHNPHIVNQGPPNCHRKKCDRNEKCVMRGGQPVCRSLSEIEKNKCQHGFKGAGDEKIPRARVEASHYSGKFPLNFLRNRRNDLEHSRRHHVFNAVRSDSEFPFESRKQIIETAGHRNEDDNGVAHTQLKHMEDEDLMREEIEMNEDEDEENRKIEDKVYDDVEEDYQETNDRMSAPRRKERLCEDRKGKSQENRERRKERKPCGRDRERGRRCENGRNHVKNDRE